MAMLTEELILAYSLDAVTDPDLRRRIERAREYDPLVQYWFDLFSPTGVERLSGEWLRRADRQAAREDAASAEPSWRVRVFKTARGYGSEHHIEYHSRGDGRSALPGPNTPAEPSYHDHDTVAQVVRLTYPAAEVPYGVARVTRKEGEAGRESVLVAFREGGSGDAAVLQAVVPFADLGIPGDADSAPHLYVEFAADDNLGAFPVDDLRRLRERCNGDRELRRAVDRVLDKLTGGAG